MMEKGWIAQRQYHEKSGRAVRSDKFLTVEDKKAKARVKRVRLQNGACRTRSQGVYSRQKLIKQQYILNLFQGES